MTVMKEDNSHSLKTESMPHHRDKQNRLTGDSRFRGRANEAGEMSTKVFIAFTTKTGEPGQQPIN